MFIASKIIALFTQPLWWITALLLAACLTLQHKPVLGRRLCTAALATLLFCGWQAIPDFFLHQLENRYAEFAPRADLKDFDGVIVLGGGTESGRVAQAHVQPLMGDSGERLTAPVVMLAHNPHLQVLYTGGEGELLGTGPSEAERAKMYFEAMGLTDQKVMYESASRNTYENAVFSGRLAGVDKTRRWLLVTSAFHMPRSMATFQKDGWNVTAYPVDFRTGHSTSWTRYGHTESISNWQIVLREWVGLVLYRLTGRL